MKNASVEVVREQPKALVPVQKHTETSQKPQKELPVLPQFGEGLPVDNRYWVVIRREYRSS